MKTKKQRSMAAALVSALLLGTLSIPGGTVSHAASKLKATAPKTVAVNQTVAIKTNVKAKFKSSNKKIATVSSKGVVKGKKAGKVKITVTSKSNKNQKKTVTITVQNKLVITEPASAKAALKVDETVKIKTNLSSKFSSSNDSVAQVSSNGTVTAKSKGTATITVTAKKYKNLVKKVTVTVEEQAESTTKVPTTEKPTSEVPTTEKPTTENKTSEQPKTEKPTSEDKITEKPTSEQPEIERPTSELTTEDTSGEEIIIISEEPTSEEPTTEKPTTEGPTTEEPTTEKPATENPTTEKPTTEKPTTEEPTTERPTSEEPTTETPSPEVTTNEVLEVQAKGMSPNFYELDEYGFIVYLKSDDVTKRLLGYDEYTVDYIDETERDGHIYQQYKITYDGIKQEVEVETVDLPDKLMYAVILSGGYEGEPLEKEIIPNFDQITDLGINFGNYWISDAHITSEEYYQNMISQGYFFGNKTYEDLKIDYNYLYWGIIDDLNANKRIDLVYDYYFEYDGNLFCMPAEINLRIDYPDN